MWTRFALNAISGDSGACHLGAGRRAASRLGHASVSALVIGDARTSLFGDDAEVQRAALAALGAAPDRVHLDAGLIGMTRPRPSLREALAAQSDGDTLAVTALFRLARSCGDALDVLGRLMALEVTLVVDEIRFPPDAQGL